MSEHVTGRTVTAAQRRNDLWLAAGLLVGAVISAWLGQVAGLYGDETPPFAWVASAAYKWIAKNRHRLPGGTPACSMPAHLRPGASRAGD